MDANEDILANLPSKDEQGLKQDYDLLEFAINIAEEFKKAIKKTRGDCTEYCRRLLITCNQFQVTAEQRLYSFQENQPFIEILQNRYQEDEQRIQQVKVLDAQILKDEVAHLVVSVQLLEDQIRLSSTRIEVIKNQAAKFEININFLELSEFESIASEAQAWKKFLNNQAGPST